MNGQELKVVDKFSYLGSTLSRAVHIDDEVTARIAKASVAFGKLRANVWKRNGIKLYTKAVWYCQPSCMHVRPGQYTSVMQRDKIPDTEVPKKAGMQNMHTVLKLAQLMWTGHVVRMLDEQFPKKVFYCELQEGKRSQGGQKKHYKDTLKASLKDFDIPIGSWEQVD